MVDLTTDPSEDEVEIGVLHQTHRYGEPKSLPDIMIQLKDIRHTILDLHANQAVERCQIQ